MTSSFPFRRLAAAALLAVGSSAAGAAPCEAVGTPWIALTVTAGAALPGSDRDTVVRVHDNGCAALHRPAFRRGAGDYRVALTPAELAALRTQAKRDELRGFDAAKVRRDVSTVRPKRDDGKDAGDHYVVLDADTYRIEWRDGAKRGAAAWTGVHAYAEAYPDVGALRAFSGVAATLEAIAARDDAQRVAGGTP